MRSDLNRALPPVLALLSWVAGPLMARDRGIMIPMCGGGAPVRLPVDNPDHQPHQTGCHALCQRKKNGCDHQSGDDWG